MSSFKRAVFQARKVADLLRVKETKERLLETCYRSDVGKAMAIDIKAFTAHIHEDRFGTLAD